MNNQFTKKEAPFQGFAGMGGGVVSRMLGAGGYEYWIATLGGSSEDESQDIALDSNENIFVVGYTQSSGAGNRDASIAKFANDGTLEWQRTLGGTGDDRFYGVTIDSSDNVYACGLSESEGAGSNDTLMVKYNNSGTLQWQKTNGTTLSDYLYSIDISSSNNVYACGVRANSSNLADIAIYVRNSAGALSSVRSFSNGGNVYGHAVAVSGSDQYIAGYFDAGSPSFDVYISKLNSSQSIVWERTLSSNLGDFPALHGLAVDTSGNLYVLVEFTDGVYPDLEVVKYNSSGTIQWQRRITQYAHLYPTAITTDSDDNVYVVAQGNGVGAGNYDWFIAKWNSSGTIQFQRALGGTSSDTPHGIKVVGDNMYITGRTQSAGEGNYDVLIAKLPKDGSKTGTYGSFTYQATSLTEAAGSLTGGSSTNFSVSSPKGSPTERTSTLTDSTSSFTETLTTI